MGLCQQVVDKKDNPNEVYGVIPYLAPEVLSGESHIKESDIYSFGMIMWEFTTGRKPFHDRPHDSYLIMDILAGKRPKITNDTPEFYVELMKRCWDHNPENRPTAREIEDSLWEYNQGNIDRTKEKEKIIELAETKRQQIIKISDTKNYKHHPKSFYTSRLLNESIQQAESLLNLPSTNLLLH